MTSLVASFFSTCTDCTGGYTDCHSEYSNNGFNTAYEQHVSGQCQPHNDPHSRRPDIHGRCRCSGMTHLVQSEPLVVNCFTEYSCLICVKQSAWVTGILMIMRLRWKLRTLQYDDRPLHRVLPCCCDLSPRTRMEDVGTSLEYA